LSVNIGVEKKVTKERVFIAEITHNNVEFRGTLHLSDGTPP